MTTKSVFQPISSFCLPTVMCLTHGSLPEGNEIRISDTSPNGFRTFLRYFYFNEYKLNIDVVGEVMYLTKKYNVDEYFEACCDFLENCENDYSGKHIIIGYELALAYELTFLRTVLERRICTDYGVVVFCSEFIRSISIDLLKRILQIDKMYLCAKLAFDACMGWAEEACNHANIDPSVMQNRRKHLGDCMEYIEFGAMKRDEIVQCVKTFGGMFTPKELERFITMIAAKYPVPFNKDKMIRYNIGKSTRGTIKIQLKSEKQANFSSRTRFLLGGIKLNLNHPDKYRYFEGMVRILELSADKQSSDDIVLLTQEIIHIDEKSSTDLMLNQAIIFEPPSNYCIQLTIDFPKHDSWHCEQTISQPEELSVQILPETNPKYIAEVLCHRLG